MSVKGRRGRAAGANPGPGCAASRLGLERPARRPAAGGGRLHTAELRFLQAESGIWRRATNARPGRPTHRRAPGPVTDRGTPRWEASLLGPAVTRERSARGGFQRLPLQPPACLKFWAPASPLSSPQPHSPARRPCRWGSDASSRCSLTGRSGTAARCRGTK